MSINLSYIRIREIEEKELKEDKDGLRFDGKQPRYSALLNPSLDILEFRRLAKEREKVTGEKIIFSRGTVEYTDVFISVSLSSNTPTQLYESGFCEWKDGQSVHYLEYKRSGSAAKNGKHLFIREDFYAPMMRWTWMGKPPIHHNIRMSYVERKAYEALVNSSIKDIVTIDPESILVLQDLEHSFVTNAAMVETDSEGKIALHRQPVTWTNMVTDGECLIDDSVFGSADCGMMLLRNFFFKSCGFRTDIQGYYRTVFGNRYETATVEDCFGFPIPVKNIRMIVSLSSLKLFKFQKYFAMDEPMEQMKSAFHSPMKLQNHKSSANDPQMQQRYEVVQEDHTDFLQDSGLNLYLEWIEAVKQNGNVFGVVKYEEKHRDKRPFTYQMINSLDLSEEDIKELLEEDIETFVTLKTEDEAYEDYVSFGKGLSGDPIYTERFLLQMVKKNPAFRNTKIYKDKKYKFLQSYLQKLYQGKITISADYRTLCSMPMEYLQYSVDRDIEHIRPVLNKGEVCILDIPEGEELVLCRNPHTCASNVVVVKNRIPPEITGWFSFLRKDNTSNIVVLSPWEWDVMAALNGADFDSDEVLCIREPMVVERAKRMLQDELIGSVPHVEEKQFQKGGKLQQGIMDYESQKGTDKLLLNNNIGRISNYVQALNSYFWDSKSKTNPALKEPDTLYDDIQILSVLVGMEIDKAKHHYTIDAGERARQLVEKHIDYTENKPLFMRFLNEKERKTAVQKASQGLWMDCPMDYVAKQIFELYTTHEKLVNKPKTATIPLEELFVFEDYKGYDAKKAEAVLEKMNSCIKALRTLHINQQNLSWEVNVKIKNDTLADTLALLKKNRIKIREMKRILSVILERDVNDIMRRKKKREGFLKALQVNNQKGIEWVNQNQCDTESQHPETKSQIDYKKCRKLFERYLNLDPNTDEEIIEFGKTVKEEKNLKNLAYMLQVLDSKRKYGYVKDETLMSLAILHLVWPELLEQCLRPQNS
ncbi:MAG: hypothetical protein PUD77_06900 [Clostridiales bacterium]|nr:hypothetical protein [Clostridiales bacterium]